MAGYDPHMNNTAPLSQFADQDRLNATCAQLIVDLAVEAIAQRGGFSLVLSGGTTPKSLYALLATPELCKQIPWSKVYLFWGDERCVPPEDPASNFAMAHSLLLSRVPVREDRFFRMKGELAPEAGALAYERELRNIPLLWKDAGAAENRPVFDLILLGIGNDGHTASLFPQSAALAEKSRLVCAVPAPPGPAAVPRLTLTLPVINNSRQVWFLAAGPKKGTIVERILAKDPAHDYPAARVNPRGTLRWFVSAV